MGKEDIELQATVTFGVDQASANAAKQATAAVTSGAETASRAAAKLRPAPGADKEFNAVTASSEKSFAAINAATNIATGGIMGVGSAVKNLVGQFPALTAAMGPIGLALAAFAAWKKVVDTVVAAHAALETSLRMIKVGNIEAQIRSNAAAYDAYYTSIKRAADERQRLTDIEAAKDDAKLRSQIAGLELSHAQQKATLAPDDEIGARKLDLSFADQRAALEEAAAKRKAEREDANLKAQEAAQMATAFTAKKQQDDDIQSFKDLANERMKIEARIQKAGAPTWYAKFSPIGALYSGATSENRMDNARVKFQPDVERLQKDQNDVVTDFRSAELKQYGANQAVSGIRSLREINRTDRGTLGVQSQTRKTENSNAAFTIDAAQFKQTEALWEEFNAVMSTRSAADRNAMRKTITTLSQQGQLNDLIIQQLTELQRQIQSNKDRARQPGG
jgi:hypothetical protein